jgi:hypothetical protein
MILKIMGPNENPKKESISMIYETFDVTKFVGSS